MKTERLYEDLGEKERQCLRQGTVPVGKTRSEMIQSIAASAVNRGWTREHFMEVMLNRSNKGAAKIFEIKEQRGLNGAKAYLDLSWRKAIEFVQRNPPISHCESALELVRLLRSRVQSMSWPGRAGPTDFAVVSAHLDIAEKVRSLTYAASIRRIAVAAGVTRETVSKSHERLRRAGFLFPVRRPDPRATSRWELRDVAK